MHRIDLAVRPVNASTSSSSRDDDNWDACTDVIAHDAYSLSDVIKKIPIVVESLAAFDDYVLFGSRDGHLLLYQIRLGGSTAEIEMKKSSRNFSRRPIQQLCVVAHLGILVSLSNSVVSVHELALHEQPGFPALGALAKTSGASLFAVDVNREKDTCRLCVVVRHRLHVFQWNESRRCFDDMEIPLSVPETPRAVVWMGNSL